MPIDVTTPMVMLKWGSSIIELGDLMELEEVCELIRGQIDKMEMKVINDHGITLKEALVPPQRIPVVERTIEKGRIIDRRLDVWLIGRERSSDGYRIVIRDDGLQFGIASNGFPTDKFLILDGWYGGLMSAFLSM